MYSESTTELERQVADYVFKVKLYYVINESRAPRVIKKLARKQADMYFSAVFKLGKKFWKKGITIISLGRIR